MHSATQILAQRAPPAARVKPRWQPYYALTSSTRSPTLHYLNTPSTVSSPQLPPFIESNRLRQTISTPPIQISKDTSQRDSTKHKFALGLIDQAVDILSEIWSPHDIPQAFIPPTKASTSVAPAINHPKQSICSSDSFNGISPLASPAAPLAQLTSSSSTLTQLADGKDQDYLLSMKTFVHEVLRRSRTSGNILQTALCYLEAVRSKVPQVLREEKIGIRAYYQPESRILPATPLELEKEAEFSLLEEETPVNDFVVDDSMKTICVVDEGDISIQLATEVDFSVSSLISEPALSATPSLLPSPILCPRRTFLAALILASKFSQDKSYSNRAWSKVSGLPPREISRCERALGQALDWRLWVGKSPFGAQPDPLLVSAARPVVRCQSEASVFTTPSLSTDACSAAQAVKPISGGHHAGLRRCSTLPEKAITSHSRPPINESDQDMGAVEKISSLSSLSAHPPTLGLKSQCSSNSPIPDVPPLTYSPTSTDSSLGDHTIQMSSFEDSMFPLPCSTQSWLDVNDARCGYPQTSLSPCFGLSCSYETFTGKDFDSKSKAGLISVVDEGSHIPCISGHGPCIFGEATGLQ